MAPAVECTGCGKRWRTERDIKGLFDATAEHSYQIGMNLAAGVVYIFAGKKRTGDLHKTRYNYYETIPAEGFENAEVV